MTRGLRALGLDFREGPVLTAVSCWAANRCIGVGRSVASDKTLAELWNGRSWEMQKAANPPGGGLITAVSCWPTQGCLAVGQDRRNQAFAEAWNGTSWKLQESPQPAFGTGENNSGTLNGVSCVSNSFCMAAGAGNGAGAVAEAWNG